LTKTEETGRAADPFETWRQLYDANERAWSDALGEAMGSTEFADSSGKLLETMLAAQKSVRDNMRTYLETMNVPTREDIARLGEIVIGLERRSTRSPTGSMRSRMPFAPCPPGRLAPPDPPGPPGVSE
jgi:polyhydroxyalkanoic acid synthase PhaR subunit